MTGRRNPLNGIPALWLGGALLILIGGGLPGRPFFMPADDALLEKIRAAVLVKNAEWESRYRTVDQYNIFGDRSRIGYVSGKGGPKVDNAAVLQPELAVRDVMTASVITVSPADSVDTCMRLCTDSRVRHLPVVDGGKVVGVVSIGDLVKAVISEQGAQIEQLQRYIAG